MGDERREGFLEGNDFGLKEIGAGDLSVVLMVEEGEGDAEVVVGGEDESG